MTEPTPEKMAELAALEATALDGAAERAAKGMESGDLDPEALALITGLMGPTEDFVGAAMTETAKARHAVYCAIFKEFLPVHSALREVAGDSSADHIVMDMFMNVLAVTMANFGDSPIG